MFTCLPCYDIFPNTMWGGDIIASLTHDALMMTSSNGCIFRVTSHLCGEFTVPRWIPRTKASDAELWYFFDLRPSKCLSKQSWGWWFETPSCPLWRQCNVMFSLPTPANDGLPHHTKFRTHAGISIHIASPLLLGFVTCFVSSYIKFLKSSSKCFAKIDKMAMLISIVIFFYSLMNIKFKNLPALVC